MSERLAEVEARLAALELRMSAVEAAGQRPARPATAAEPPPAATLHEASVSSAATYLGRVLLIFGGGYLLRALTDLGILPTQAGIPIGATYALFWLYVAHRLAAQPARRTGARIYGAVSALMALPLLVEAVTRFELLGGAQSALALAAFCALYLLVAALRELRSLAWLATAGALLTALVLSKASGTAVPFILLSIAIGLASLWLAYLRRWRGLQWLGAVGANLGVVALLVLSHSIHWTVAPLAAYVLGAVLWSAYLLSFAFRSHVQGHPPGVFEAAQAVCASAIAFVAALHAAYFGHAWASILGTLALVFGIGAYGLALTPRTRLNRDRSYYFYSALGLVLLVGGSVLLVPPALAAAAWSVLAVGMAWASGRHDRVVLSLHCTLLLVAAGVASGTLARGAVAFASDAAHGWPALSPWAVLVTAATVACLFIPVAQRSQRWGALAVLPQLVVLALAVWSVGGLIVTAAAPLVAGVPGPSTDGGSLAALRTTVLGLAAVTLALSCRHRRWPEARWLAYPVLVLLGVKLVLEDFPSGRPITLFIALAVVGGALILVSRLMPRGSAGTRPASA
jgi:hypothetical protein